MSRHAHHVVQCGDDTDRDGHDDGDDDGDDDDQLMTVDDSCRFSVQKSVHSRNQPDTSSPTVSV